MPDLSVFESVSVVEDVRTQDELFLTGWEYLWGVTKTGAWALGPNANMEDLAFNDQVASGASASAEASLDPMQDTQLTDFSAIETVEAQVRMRIDAAMVNDTILVEIYDGVGWQTLEYFDVNNQMAQTLTTYTYDVTSFLNSIAKINAAVVRWTGVKIGGGDYNFEVDEARIRVKFLQPNVYDDVTVQENVSMELRSYVNVYDDVSITEYVEPPDICYCLAPTEDISIAEYALASIPFLYVDVYDEVSVAEQASVIDLVIEVGPVYDAVSLAEYVDILDIIIEIPLVHDEATIEEAVDLSRYNDPAEVLWGETVLSSWTVTNKQNAEDKIFDDQVAVVDTSTGDGNVRWSAIEDTDELNSDFLDRVVLNVRFRFSGAITVGRIELSLNNGETDTLLETFDSGNPLTVLTTKQYDVTAQLDTKKRIDRASVMLRSWGLTSPNIELDEVQLLVYTRKPAVSEDITVTEVPSLYLPELFASAYEDILITEVAPLNDLIVELGVVPDFISIAEVVTLQLDQLFLSVAEDISIADVLTIDLEIAVSLYEEVSIVEYGTVHDIIVELGVSETVTIVEDVALDQPLDLEISEAVSIVENIAVKIMGLLDVLETVIVDEKVFVDLIYLVDVSETLTVTEDFSILNPEMFIDLAELIAVADVAVMNDLIVELGPVVETLSVVEDLAIDLPIEISEYEELTVSEFATVFDIIVELEAYEEINIAEYATVFDLIIELFAFDTVATIEDLLTGSDVIVSDEVGFGDALIDLIFLAEYAEIVLPELFVDVGDEIAVSEYANIWDIIVELLAVDYASVQDVAEVLIAHFAIQAFDVVTVEEYANLWDIVVELMAIETVTVDESAELVHIHYILAYEDIETGELVTVAVLMDVEVYEDVTVAEDSDLLPLTWTLHPRLFQAQPRERFFTADYTVETSRARIPI